MGLIKCIDCGKEFSDRAPACPNCGCPTSAILGELQKQEKKKTISIEKKASSKEEKLFCNVCGNELPADSDFCQYCGNKISSPSEEERLENTRGFANVKKEDSDQMPNTEEEPKKKFLSSLTKKKKIVIPVIFGIIVAIIIAVIIVVNYRNKTAFNRQLRNMATETMSEGFSNVYANVIVIDPVYYIYDNNTISSWPDYKEGMLSRIVCKCKTKEGSYVWVVFKYKDYPGGTGSKNAKEYQKLLYGYRNPKLLTGRIKTAQAVNSDIYAEIGDVFVLYFQQ